MDDFFESSQFEKSSNLNEVQNIIYQKENVVFHRVLAPRQPWQTSLHVILIIACVNILRKLAGYIRDMQMI